MYSIVVSYYQNETYISETFSNVFAEIPEFEKSIEYQEGKIDYQEYELVLVLADKADINGTELERLRANLEPDSPSNFATFERYVSIRVNGSEKFFGWTDDEEEINVDEEEKKLTVNLLGITSQISDLPTTFTFLEPVNIYWFIRQITDQYTGLFGTETTQQPNTGFIDENNLYYGHIDMNIYQDVMFYADNYRVSFADLVKQLCRLIKCFFVRISSDSYFFSKTPPENIPNYSCDIVRTSKHFKTLKQDADFAFTEGIYLSCTRNTNYSKMIVTGNLTEDDFTNVVVVDDSGHLWKVIDQNNNYLTERTALTLIHYPDELPTTPYMVDSNGTLANQDDTSILFIYDTVENFNDVDILDHNFLNSLIDNSDESIVEETYKGLSSNALKLGKWFINKDGKRRLIINEKRDYRFFDESMQPVEFTAIGWE